MSNEEKFPIEDWQYEVANGDTKLGYAEWVKHQLDIKNHDLRETRRQYEQR